MVGICRLCASLRKMDALTTLIDASHEVCRKLRECFRVEIRMEDPLPKNVCTECIQALQASYVFYSKVQESQDSLAILFPTAPETALPTSKLAESLAHVAQSSVESAEEDSNLPKHTERKRKLPPQDNLGSKVSKVSKVEFKVDYKFVKAKEVKDKQEKISPPNKVPRPDEDYLLEVYEVLDMQPNAELSLAEEPPAEQENIVEMLSDDEDEGSSANLQLIEEYITKTDDNGAVEKTKTQHEPKLYAQQANVDNQRKMHDEADEQGKQEEVLLDDVEFQEELKQLEESLEEEEDNLEVIDQVPEEKEEEEVGPEAEEHLQEEHTEDKRNAIIYAEMQHETWSAYPWRCSLCTHIADSFIELNAHAQKIHTTENYDDLQYTCSDCQKTCARYTLFLNHVRMHHHPLLALCCDACDTRCEDFAALDYHRRSDECVADVNDVYPEVQMCADCGKSYGRQSAVQVHARTQHTETVKSFACDMCGMRFKRMGNLRAHQRVHSDDKAFACDLCGREFKHKINLEVHYFTHISEKQFECTICKKKFKTSINLEKHAIVHTDIKQWKCSFCEKEFRTKDAQKSHERTHTGELPYACNYCERRFRYRSTLTSHTNTHENVKPYSCQECDHYFNNWSNYNKHMKRRHSAEAVAKAAEKKLVNKKSKTSKMPILAKQQVVSYIYDEQGEIVQSADADLSFEVLEMPTEDVDILEQANSGEEEESLS